MRDLELIDKHCVNQLEEVRAMTEGTEEERVMFEALDYTWATPAADGKTLLDLCPNGRDLPVRFEDRLDYARKVEAARLNEFRFVQAGQPPSPPPHSLLHGTTQLCRVSC